MKRVALNYLAHLAFGVAAVVIIIVLGWVLYDAAIESREATRRVYHTEEVLFAIGRTNENLGRAESAQRGYLHSGNDAFLSERDQFLAILGAAAADSVKLTADNPVQQARAHELEELLAERVAIMKEIAAQRRVEGMEAAALASVDAGKQASAKIYDLTEAMRQDERTILQMRAADENRRNEGILVFLAIAGAVILIILIPGYLGHLFQARARMRAERKLMDLTESLPGALFQYWSSPDDIARGAFEFVSKSVAKQYGISRESLLADSKAFWERVVQEDTPALVAAAHEAARTLTPLRHDFRIAHGASGATRWIRSVATVRKEPDGRFLWNGYWSDITETKEAEAALHNKEQEIRALVDHLVDCVITIDSHGIVRNANRAVTRVLGYGAAEVIGQNVAMLMPEPHRSGHDAYLEQYARTGAARIIGVGREVEGRHKDGRLIPMDLAVSEFMVQGERFFVGTLRDISERKQFIAELTKAREDAERSTRAKSVFLATMSHEIRTPMNGVLGMLELLGLTKLEPGQRNTLGVVRESGKSLLRIIDDILDFSKIEAGKLEVRPEPASIATTVEAVRSIYDASSKGLLITCSVDPGISPALLFDPMRVRQILNNLVSNALKFTTKGHVEIKAELMERADGEERVRFSVQDTGIGISPEDQARLFQPFAQAAGKTAAKFGGTGLGLTICRRLATLMGGTIEMVSKPGVGTTMVLELTLPVADSKDLPKIDRVSTHDSLITAISMRRMAPDSAQAQAEGTLMLLVDDHPVNRELVLLQVNTLGYAAECAKDGVEALEMWKSGRFGIVITDCNMPEMDGYELAQTIRKLESANGGTRVPIIACTANALGGEAEICFAAGMDDYLAKPAELKDLAEKLDQWLPIPRPGASISQVSQVSQVAPIDRAVIAGLTGGDAAVERKVLEIFQRTNVEDVAILRRALVERDSAQVVRSAHRIKGASRTMGATSLAAVCERLERAGRAGDWSVVEADYGCVPP